jgi:F1F0 ATPase subunit 2
MNDAWVLLLSSLTGVALGIIFFGGLWFTVRKGVSSRCPALWFCASLLLRTSIVLSGFYFTSGQHWERLLVCFLAFVITRVVVMRLTRVIKKPTHQAQEA